jgi:hypothetical protein
MQQEVQVDRAQTHWGLMDRTNPWLLLEDMDIFQALQELDLTPMDFLLGYA